MSLIHVNDASFEADVLKSEKTVFVDFWAAWCGPCRMLAPKFENASNTYGDRAVFAKYDVDESSDRANECGVRGIPTIIAFRNGEEVDQRTGSCDQATLNAFIERNL